MTSEIFLLLFQMGKVLSFSKGCWVERYEYEKSLTFLHYMINEIHIQVKHSLANMDLKGFIFIFIYSCFQYSYLHIFIYMNIWLFSFIFVDNFIALYFYMSYHDISMYLYTFLKLCFVKRKMIMHQLAESFDESGKL